MTDVYVLQMASFVEAVSGKRRSEPRGCQVRVGAMGSLSANPNVAQDVSVGDRG